MKPAYSVLFLTTLLGAGHGLFLALYGVEVAVWAGRVPPQDPVVFFGAGGAVVLGLLGLGLVASVFHLGRPERGWRAFSQWRTSWLSREVIVLPLFMAAVFAYAVAHVVGYGATLWLGAAGVVLCVALFVCTGMIYACLKFLQEWHTPLTVINYFLLGTASGIPIANAVSQGLDLEPQHWQELASAPDKNTIDKLIKEYTGREDRSNKLSIMIDREGTLWAVNGKNMWFIGSLEVNDKDETIKKAINRIIERSGIIQR